MSNAQRNRSAEPPRCFTQAQWDMWRKAAAHPLLATNAHHCTDCTPSHQGAMHRLERCDNPFGEATRDRDGFVQITPPNPAKEAP